MSSGPIEPLASLPDVAAVREVMGHARLCLACIVAQSRINESRAREILSELGEKIQIARLAHACGGCRACD